MTLSVDALRRDNDGSWVELPLTSNLAGLERTRVTFFGSPWARSLGLELLPRLRTESQLWVSGKELGELRAEVETLLRAISGRDDEEYWAHRLGNIAEAITVAASFGEAGAVAIS